MYYPIRYQQKQPYVSAPSQTSQTKFVGLASKIHRLLSFSTKDHKSSENLEYKVLSVLGLNKIAAQQRDF
jgi:hypothetical protein